MSTTRSTLFAACLMAAAGGCTAGGGATPDVRESIQVESKDGKVLVQVTVDNRSGRTVYVPRSLALEKELSGRLFTVRDAASGDELDYTGRMVKRGPLTSADYVAVQPRSRHTNTLDISAAYDFRPGPHAYELRYDGSYLADVSRLEAATPVAPPPVQFSHTGQ